MGWKQAIQYITSCYTSYSLYIFEEGKIKFWCLQIIYNNFISFFVVVYLTDIYDVTHLMNMNIEKWMNWWSSKSSVVYIPTNHIISTIYYVGSIPFRMSFFYFVFVWNQQLQLLLILRLFFLISTEFLGVI